MTSPIDKARQADLNYVLSSNPVRVASGKTHLLGSGHWYNLR